jgi:hypothetical protein
VRTTSIFYKEKLAPAWPELGTACYPSFAREQGIKDHSSQGITDHSSRGITDHSSRGITDYSSRGNILLCHGGFEYSFSKAPIMKILCIGVVNWNLN